EQWDCRLRLLQQGLGLSEFAVRSDARILALLHQFDEMLVSGDLVFGEDQARLRAAYLHIGISGFRGNCDASSRLGSFGRLRLGGSSLSSFFQSAEQIRFPARNESEIVVVLSAAIAGQVRGETARHTFSRLVQCGRRSVKVS